MRSRWRAIAARRRSSKSRLDEIVTVTVAGPKGDTIVDRDEGPRPDSSIEGLAKLRPVVRQDEGR